MMMMMIMMMMNCFVVWYLILLVLHTKKRFSIKDFFSKCDQIHRKLRIWSHLLKKSLMENFIFVQCGLHLTARVLTRAFVGPSATEFTIIFPIEFYTYNKYFCQGSFHSQCLLVYSIMFLF